MRGLSWATFRQAWLLFIGAILSVCVGVALVVSALRLLIATSAALLHQTTGDGGLSQRALQVQNGYATATSLLGIALTLALFLTIFVVASTFAFTVAQRRRELALLRLVGASRRQVRRLLTGEAVLLGTIGSAAGAALAPAATAIQTGLLHRFGLVPAGFTAGWHWWLLAVGWGSGVLIAVCGVLVASWRGSRVPPLAALRAGGDTGPVMTKPRTILGLGLLVGAAVLAGLLPWLESQMTLGLALTLPLGLVFTLVLAAVALSPLLVSTVGRLGSRLTRGNVVTTLALASLRTGMRRSASIAAPVIALVALVLALTSTALLTNHSSRNEQAANTRADLVVTAGHATDHKLAATRGVATVSPQAHVPAQLINQAHPHDTSNTTTTADAVTPRPYLRTHRHAVHTGHLTRLRAGTVAVNPSGAGVAEALDRASNTDSPHPHIGDRITVRIGGHRPTLRIVALLPDSQNGPSMLVPHKWATRQLESDTPRRYLIRAAPGTQVHTVRQRITAANLGTVQTKAQWVQKQASQNNRSSTDMLIILLGLATVYVIIAIINTVIIADSQRRNELATARLAGFTRTQVVTATVAESLAASGTGIILGAAAAATTIAADMAALHQATGHTQLVVPWQLLAALTVGALIIVAATSILTTLTATTKPPIQEANPRE